MWPVQEVVRLPPFLSEEKQELPSTVSIDDSSSEITALHPLMLLVLYTGSSGCYGNATISALESPGVTSFSDDLAWQ